MISVEHVAASVVSIDEDGANSEPAILHKEYGEGETLIDALNQLVSALKDEPCFSGEARWTEYASWHPKLKAFKLIENEMPGPLFLAGVIDETSWSIAVNR